MPFWMLTSNRKVLSCYPCYDFIKDKGNLEYLPLLQTVFMKCEKTLFCTHAPRHDRITPLFLGVGMEISNLGRGAQQHRALCAPETQPLIYCCKCRGQPSCQRWKARMLMFKLLSQTDIFLVFPARKSAVCSLEDTPNTST